MPSRCRESRPGYVRVVTTSPDPATNAVRREEKARGPTRLSWAWATVIAGLVLGIALVDFLVQNSHSSRIEFFSVSGSIPMSVALLAAALAGAMVAVVIGIARMVQIRRGLSDGHSQRFRRKARREEVARDDPAATSDEIASPT